MTREDFEYWAQGARIIELSLAKSQLADPVDAPSPLTGDAVALWHQAQAAAYRHALEMMAPQPQHLALAEHDRAMEALGRRFLGLDVQLRRDGVSWSWPAKWRARLVTSKGERERYRLTTYGETRLDAERALLAAVAEVDRA